MPDLSGPDQAHLGCSPHPRDPIYKLILGLLWMDVEPMPRSAHLQPHLLKNASDPHLSPRWCFPSPWYTMDTADPSFAPCSDLWGWAWPVCINLCLTPSWGSPLLCAPRHSFSMPRLLTVTPGNVISDGDFGTNFTETFWFYSYYWQFSIIICPVALTKLFFNKCIT